MTPADVTAITVTATTPTAPTAAAPIHTVTAIAAIAVVSTAMTTACDLMYTRFTVIVQTEAAVDVLADAALGARPTEAS